MADVTRFDGPQIDVEAASEGGWRWTAGYVRHDVSGVIWDLNDAPCGARSGSTFTRSAGLRAARRQLRRERRFARRRLKNISQGWIKEMA